MVLVRNLYWLDGRRVDALVRLTLDVAPELCHVLATGAFLRLGDIGLDRLRLVLLGLLVGMNILHLLEIEI